MNLPSNSTDFDYVFDNIGNVEHKSINGSITNSFTANNLNQYSSINGTNLTYDLDGNMLSNNGWTYTWNGENRMIMASNSEHVISYKYDFQGRMFKKVIDGATNEFIWDDFNIIAETSEAHTNYNVWGLDLSGTLQGAGGVGGLLAVVQDGETYFTSMDANGNITEYVSDDGNIVAHREYSAFGETINLTGDKKDDFTHWFSTKPWDEITGMSEYEYRKYSPECGRFISRDPIGDLSFTLLKSFRLLRLSQNFMNDYYTYPTKGWYGFDLYGFVKNQPLTQYDYLGLEVYDSDGKASSWTSGCSENQLGETMIDGYLRGCRLGFCKDGLEFCQMKLICQRTVFHGYRWQQDKSGDYPKGPKCSGCKESSYWD